MKSKKIWAIIIVIIALILLFPIPMRLRDGGSIRFQALLYSDLKIKAEGVNTTKLVKFNGNLYGESFAIIDYAGDLNKSIGKIDFLIEEEYLPQLDNETNCKKFFGAKVLEANDKNMILNVNNDVVLFNVIKKENIKKTNGELLYENEEF